MKYGFIFLVIIVLFPFNVPAADSDSGEAFLEASKRLPVAERIERAREAIRNSDDNAVVAEAVRDLAKFAVTPERAQNALVDIDALIAKSEGNPEVSHRANLARARLLARLGRIEESHSIFNRAVEERWSRDVFKRFYETLWETGQYALLAGSEYERHTTDEFSDDDREFYECERDFMEMFGRMRAMRVVFPESSAMEDVFPRLEESKRRPLAIRIARALCLAADERYVESIQLLEEIEQALESGTAPDSEYDESKDLPLYLATVLFFEGRDFDAARAAFREYMDRNEDTRTRVLERALKMTYAMEHASQDKRRIIELTGLLVESEFMTDKQIREEFPDSNIASLLTMHQLGLACRGEWHESRELCFELMDKYYPQTLAGANAAMSLAVNLWWHYGHTEAAERLLRDILLNAPYDGLVPHAERLLGELVLERGDDENALFFIDDAINRIGFFGKGPMSNCKRKALELREQATKSWAQRHPESKQIARMFTTTPLPECLVSVTTTRMGPMVMTMMVVTLDLCKWVTHLSGPGIGKRTAMMGWITFMTKWVWQWMNGMIGKQSTRRPRGGQPSNWKM